MIQENNFLNIIINLPCKETFIWVNDVDQCSSSYNFIFLKPQNLIHED